MIVAAHQPGYLPGVSVIAKLARADAVVWLDNARFTMPGFVNRNQLPNGHWLTVPVDRQDHRTPIRDVTIAGGGWHHRHLRALRGSYRNAAHYDQRIESILEGSWAKAGEPLADLNLRLIALILSDLGITVQQHRQYFLGEWPGSLSSRIAKMVRAVGGTTYLSGPSKRLDAEAFKREGVELAFFTFAGANPSVVDPLFRTGQLPTEPKQVVSAA